MGIYCKRDMRELDGIHICQNWMHIIAYKLLIRWIKKGKNNFNFGIYLRISQDTEGTRLNCRKQSYEERLKGYE